MSIPLPLISILVPILAIPLLLLTRKTPNLRELVSLSAAGLLLATTTSIASGYGAGERYMFSLAEIVPGLSIAFDVEPLGIIFSLIASGLWVINTLYSIGYMRGNNERKQTRFYCYFAIAIASTMGIAWSGNLVTLFLFYEILTLSTYPLVTHKGDEKSYRSGRTYLGVLLFSSIGLLLFAIIWTWQLAGRVDFTPGGILEGHASPLQAGILLFLFAWGIGKAALMPMHRWLPAAMVAPTPVSALLHAVAVVKAGVFTITKVVCYTFGTGLVSNLPAAEWLTIIAGTSILTASWIALKQDNLKKRLAYSTVSQLSYITMAALLATPMAITAAAFHLVAHAFGKITLFFAAGAVYTASHKTEISDMHGIGRRMPWTMAAFSIAALSMIGLPPVVGFISKWYLLQGAFETLNLFVIVVMILSTLLNAAYFLPIIYNAWFRPATDSQEHGEAPLAILIAMLVTALMTLALFFYPDYFLELAKLLSANTQ